MAAPTVAATPATLVLATRNRGKILELHVLLAGLPLRIQTLAEYPDVPEIEEQGDSYLANARTKALAVARACRLPAFADDSGLEVDAIGGRPGIHSARYTRGGPTTNVTRLLQELDGVPDEQRTARFRCVVVVARPDGQTLAAEGACEGRIAHAPAGSGGFGYDPIFFDEQSGLTFAELPAERKNEISHRARACATLRPKLLEFLMRGGLQASQRDASD